ncbi:hypothetical protein [Actinomadura rudentiformis]|uniref:hypothetical protein n=1 Tax=Actinomadura rudentiformis TaxID=359158 RepID=UPI00178C7208|nr:hypothetical protein [Actinomadura rudentiformis]
MSEPAEDGHDEGEYALRANASGVPAPLLNGMTRHGRILQTDATAGAFRKIHPKHHPR